MKTSFLITILLLVVFNGGCTSANKAQLKASSNTDAPNVELVKLATQAYIYAYPMMTMHFTHKISANVEQDNGVGKAPINQWGNMRAFPKAGFTDVVRPNLDTYYSVIYADLADGPLYLYIPPTERYYLMPILNAHGDVIHSVGTRTTGQAGLHIALVGPSYEGSVDDDLLLIRSQTNLNWMLGRVAVKNDTDGQSEVTNFQQQLIAKPLAERSNDQYVSPKGVIDSQYLGLVPMDVVDTMEIADYLTLAMTLLEQNPAYAEDAPLLEKLTKIGFRPGGQFNSEQFSQATQEAMAKVPMLVQQQFAQMTAKPPTQNLQNGWNVITTGLGEYGTEYFLRAYVTKVGYGANQAVDAIYPNAAVDSEGNNFNGSDRYMLHFDADKIPPVNGFWSLTLYDKKGFLVDNSIDRYNLGSMKDLVYNNDGSLDLYIQAEAPLNNTANWLPSPGAGKEFELTFRMYYPKQTVLTRDFVMPGVKRVK